MTWCSEKKTAMLSPKRFFVNKFYPYKSRHSVLRIDRIHIFALKEVTIATIIVILTFYSVSASSGKFTIVNSSAYAFEISGTTENNNLFESISTLRPLTAQSVRIRGLINATKRMQIEYGNRLKLCLAIDPNGVKLEDVKHDSSVSYHYDSSRNTLTIRATDPNIDKFSFIVSSDPQPYRLENNGDPNAQRQLWLKSTSPVFNRLAREESDAHLMIVNGDLTEFGRTTQWKTFELAVSRITVPMAYGLGNHDYENNVEDCIDVDPKETDDSFSEHFPSLFVSTGRSRPNVEELGDPVGGFFSPKKYLKRAKNLCARRMVKRMRVHKSHLEKVLSDFSSDEGSLAYAWNYGSILRFVQLHNRPNYTVELKGFFAKTDNIKSSYDWLIADMNAYKDRSYILNVHNALEQPDLETLRPYFGRIKAIFSGHTHVAGIKCFNGIAIFDSGALFKNEFLRVDFSQGGRCFNILHFVQEKYVSPFANDYCFHSVLENPCK